MTTATAPVTVGRFLRPTPLAFNNKTLLAIEIHRKPLEGAISPLDMGWHLAFVYPDETQVEQYAYHTPGSANETASWCAIRQGLPWDRTGFPKGLVRS